jgi:hypothetical protein
MPPGLLHAVLKVEAVEKVHPLCMIGSVLRVED